MRTLPAGFSYAQAAAACAAVAEDLARLLVCPRCGELLWRSAHWWSCPRGHGKLIPPRLLARALRDVNRERFANQRSAEAFLNQFAAAQRQAKGATP